MNVLIISCFYQPRESSRTTNVYNFFKKRRDNVKIIASNFSHHNHEYQEFEDDNVITINVPKYKKNLSIKRLLSHFVFARKLKRVLKKNYNIDLYYIIVPPNYSSLIAAKHAKNRNKKSIVDVLDIWPNQNITRKRKLSFFNKWHSFRYKTTEIADFVIYQSIAYKNYIKLDNNSMLINLSRKSDFSVKNMSNKEAPLKFVYLGAISGIYDFKLILDLLINIENSTIDIIGDGELKDEFLKSLKSNNIKFNYHGVIYDEKHKNEILSKADFGLNCFKSNMIIGQSFKSLDYMSVGLPIINSLKYDTWEIVDKYQAGVNYETDNFSWLVKRLNNISKSEITNMKKNTIKAFENEFDIKILEEKMFNIIEKMEL